MKRAHSVMFSMSDRGFFFYSSVEVQDTNWPLDLNIFVHFQEIQLGSANLEMSHVRFLFIYSKPYGLSDFTCRFQHTLTDITLLSRTSLLSKKYPKFYGSFISVLQFQVVACLNSNRLLGGWAPSFSVNNCSWRNK